MRQRILAAVAVGWLAAGSATAAEPIIIESFRDGQNYQWFQTADDTWLESAAKSAAEGLRASKSVFNTADDRVSSARFQPDLPEAGLYEVFVTYPKSGNATGVVIKVNSADGEKQITQDQNGRDPNATTPADRWISLGTFRFEKGASGYVEISDPGTGVRANPREPNARVYADAVKFVPAGATSVASSSTAPPAAPPASPSATGLPVFGSESPAAAPLPPLAAAQQPAAAAGAPPPALSTAGLPPLSASTSGSAKPSMSEEDVKAKLALTNARLDGAAAMMEGRTPAAVPEVGLEAALPPPPSGAGGLPALPTGAAALPPLPSGPAALPALPGGQTAAPALPSSPGGLPPLPSGGAASAALPSLAALPTAAVTPEAVAATPALPRLDQPAPPASSPAPPALPLPAAAGLPALGSASSPPAGLPTLDSAAPPAAPAAPTPAAAEGLGALPPVGGQTPALPSLPGSGAPAGMPNLPLSGSASGTLPSLAATGTNASVGVGRGLDAPSGPSMMAQTADSAGRATTLPNSTLPWMLDMGTASEAARNSGRNVLILFVAPGNRVVERLDREFFESPAMRDLLAKFVLARVSFVNNSRVAYRLGVYGAGTIAVTTPNGEPLKTVVEIPPSPDDLAKILSDAATSKP